MFQFPPWFVPGRNSREHLLEYKEKQQPYRIAVEFRKAGWLDHGSASKTFDFLNQNGINYIAVDEPQGFTTSVPPLVEVTGDFANTNRGDQDPYNADLLRQVLDEEELP